MTEAAEPAPSGYPAGFSGYPPLAAPAWTPPVATRSGGSLLLEFGVGLAVLVGVGLLGLPLGWLWQTIAPHTPAIREADGAYLTDPEGEQRIADEGWYLLLTVALGVVLVILVWVLLRRFRGPILALALTFGALACGIITWKFGHHFGYAHARALIDAPSWTGSTPFTLPVDLRAAKAGLWGGWLPYARGDVLAMPITVLLLYLLFAGFSPYPSLRATPEDQRPAFAGPVPGAGQPYPLPPPGAGQPYEGLPPGVGQPYMQPLPPGGQPYQPGPAPQGQPGGWAPAPNGRPAPPYHDFFPGPAQQPGQAQPEQPGPEGQQPGAADDPPR
jgi:hypothetical protein